MSQKGRRGSPLSSCDNGCEQQFWSRPGRQRRSARSTSFSRMIPKVKAKSKMAGRTQMARSHSAEPAKISSLRISACQPSRQLVRQTLPLAILGVGWRPWLDMGICLLCLCLMLRIARSRALAVVPRPGYRIHARVTETIEALTFSRRLQYQERLAASGT